MDSAHGAGSRSREVNKNAKKWDEAIIRQIVSLEVGSPDAQDQTLARQERDARGIEGDLRTGRGARGR